MRMKKLFSFIIALVLIVGTVNAAFIANAQECSWTLYVDGQPYSTSASYYKSGQLRYNEQTVYINGFTGKTIEAIPGGYYGDDDAPVLKIDVTGNCTLTGDILGDGTYGALYAEPRQGGSGKDSRVYITSSNGGTLNITKRDSSYSQSSSSPKAYNAVTADEVVLGGSLNLNITTELYGVGTQTSPKEVAGIYAGSLISLANNGINNISVSAGSTLIPRPSGIVSEYFSYAKVYGIYSKGGTTGVRFGGAGGYTNVDISKTNTKASDSCCVKASNTIYLLHYAAAVYLNAGKYAVSSPKTITNLVDLKLFAADLDDFHYAAYLPKDIASNTALTEIKAKDVISSKLYKIGETPKNDTNYQSAGSCYVRRLVKQTWNLSNGAFYNFDTFVDDGSYAYFCDFVPKAGYWCSAVSNDSLDIDSIQTECNLPTKPGMAQYIYATASNIPRYIVGYVYNGPKVQSYVSDSTVDSVGVVNFNVAPTGSDEGYTYQWGYGDSFTAITDSANVNGAKTKTLTISGTASNPNCSLPFNGQTIVCKVSNIYGTYTTEPAVLTVKHTRNGDYVSGKENHSYTCYCGEVIEENHTVVIDKAVDATCTETGLTEGKHCSVCNAVLVAQTVVAAKGHTEAIDKAVAATCTKTGLTEGKHCSVCNAVLVAQTVVAAKGHTEAIDKAVAATCTKTGLTEGKHCSVCNAVLVAQEVVAPTGSHTYETTTTKATTTKDGKAVTACKVCGDVSSTTVIYKASSVKLSKTSYTYNGKVQKPTVTVKDSKGKTLKNGTDYTVSYASGCKNTGKYAVKITFKGNYSGTKTLYFNILPSKTSKLSASQTTSSIKATWKAVTGASGYKVVIYKGSKAVKTVYTTKTSYTFSKLSKGTTYKVRVTAYKTIDGKKVSSSVYTQLTTATKPGTPSLKVTAGTKKASLSWNKQTGASGYVVYMATSKNGTYKKIATVKGGTKVSYTKTGLTKGKTYYFKVRAYVTPDSKTTVYGDYSAVKSGKIK